MTSLYKFKHQKFKTYFLKLIFKTTKIFWRM